MDIKPGILLFVVTTLLSSCVSGHNDRVLLRDISALTLRHGLQTNARRSSPVPQLKCVGGTAGCTSFVPQVIQCQNRGFDGYDVQWECKTDMDNAYRFGQVEVTCEGYDYPDDPYVLRGSCGLEYTLDLTKEGHQQKQQGQHDYYGNQRTYDNDYHDRSSDYYNSYNYKKSSSGFGNLLFLGGAACIIYLIYKTCLTTPAPGAAGPNPDDPPPYSRHDHGPGPQASAPPPGFKPEFTDHTQSGYTGASGGGFTNPGYTNQGYTNTGYANTGHTNTNTNNSNGWGFWSGMGAGGLMGYLFGNSGNRGYNSYGYGPSYRQRPYGSSWGNGGNSWFGGNTGGNSWFGGNGGRSSGWGSSRSSGWGSSGSSFGGSSSSSSGTRTASGFGGTKRR